VPIRGVLNEKIDDQLAAVWHILNTPGFEPPEPNPVRVLRLSGVPERNERPIVIHDVMKDGDKTYLFPLVIGLPNRHNILFDLETNRLAAWWLGDTARQRTKGKSWYWETGAKSIVDPGLSRSELSILIGESEVFPRTASQFIADLDMYGPIASGRKSNGLQVETRLTFPVSDVPTRKAPPETDVQVTQFFSTLPAESAGFRRTVRVQGRGKVDQVRLQVVSPELARECQWDGISQSLSLPGQSGITVRVISPLAIAWHDDGSLLAPTDPRPQLPGSWFANFSFEYVTALSNDQYLADAPPVVPVTAASVEVAPGFSARRLPLADDIMPSGFAWTRRGDLVFGTLKGQAFLAFDSNRDEEEDTLRLATDGLATPYGIHAGEGYLDVLAKDGIFRLMHFDEQDGAKIVQRVAGGWGCTDDYHDWAVGLVPDGKDKYLVALPCQQDGRSDPAAAYRGKILRVTPDRQSAGSKRTDFFQVVSSGHRFPMGLARNRDGELFVTDNQGNYNPFNELNHVRQGAHFGFINALEKEKGFKVPPLDEPAIDIPHPWTRSVNGICFLETPVERASSLVPGTKQAGTLALRKSIFGPLEGHLVGCEYDTRRLIRMSLQKVGDTYQGAAYPLSIPTEDVEKGLLGPIVCAVKPTTGELYVGEIRDSGWGAGNNIGQIVKIKIELEKLPCGIAEVRATSTGFTIDFFQPVDRAKAGDAASYSISSYRRESTPAYGGNDIDRRTESIKSIALDDSGKRVTLTLPELRAGHSYELKLKNLTPGGGVFHPDEAHYTLRKIPQ
jgi:hypothetical protein